MFIVRTMPNEHLSCFLINKILIICILYISDEKEK